MYSEVVFTVAGSPRISTVGFCPYPLKYNIRNALKNNSLLEMLDILGFGGNIFFFLFFFIDCPLNN
jgi:hypothetical protein